jgi:hypothetical protein
MAEERKLSQEELDAILKEALDRFQEVENAERDQRSLAIEDARFAHAEDGQWEENAIERRKDRPRYTLDRVSGALDQVNGDQRQNRTQIKVRPQVGGKKDVAKIKMGLARSIENNSDATSIYDMAFDEQITSGYGGWRFLTQFTDDDSFDQEIVMEPIRSAASSLYLDPSAKKYDKRDGMWGFLIEEVPLEKYKKDFPNASITDFSQRQYYSGACNGWFQENIIRLAEYWRVELVDTELALMSDGSVIDLKEEAAVIDELAEKGITILKTRKSKKRKVESFIMNGAEILKGPMPWAGKYIPLVPVYGRTYNIQGKDYIRGMVRKAKDPQRIYNYTASNEIETSALTPKDPYWITAKQAKGHEPALRSFNTTNSPFLQYNADPEAPGPPQRTGAPSFQQALVAQKQAASMDIYATTGIQPPSLGLNPEMQSGKAIIAQQKMGDRSTFVFSDNLHKSIKFGGDILEDLMPRIYDRQRVVTILNFDGTTEEVEINAAALDDFNMPIVDEETGKQVIVNDLSAGKYETYIEAGPSFTTLRDESAQQLIDLATGSPRFEALATDLIAKNLNILESEELTQRIRAQMIQEGIVKPTDEEVQELGLGQPQEPSPEQVALLENLQMQTAQIMAEIENTNADTDNKDAKTLQTNMASQKAAIDALNVLMDAYEKQVNLGIPLGIDSHMIRKAQEGVVNLSQEKLAGSTI